MSPAKRPEPEIRPQLEEKSETEETVIETPDTPIEPEIVVKNHDSLVNSSETRPKKKKRKKKPRLVIT